MPAHLDESEYVRLHARELCAAFALCCGALDATISESACRTALEEQGKMMLASARAEGRVYDGAAAARCVQNVFGAISICAIDWSVPALVAAKNECQGVMPGISPIGGPCASQDECARREGFRVRCASSGSRNVCVAQRLAGLGEPCDGRDVVCDEDLARCDRDTLRCAPRRTLGEACVDDGDCYSDGCREGRCIPTIVPTADACRSMPR